jgi:hypothetical protein
MIKSPYLEQLVKRLDAVWPGAFQCLRELDQIPKKSALEVVCILLTNACQSQNEENIRLGREGLEAIPPTWLQTVLPEAIEKSLNLGDEWEYRRLLEVLHDLFPELLPEYVNRGLAAKDAEIRETAEDFIKPH